MTMADRTKIVRGLLSLSLVAALPAMADQKAPAYEMTADGVVQIAPDGHVSDYRLNDGLSPTIAELVRKSVMGWRFEPVVVDGRAVVAKTAMQIELSAEPAAGKADEFVVRVTEVKFGSPKRAGGRPPHYPEQAAHAGLTAKTVVAIRLDGDGKVVEAVPYQTHLSTQFPGENQAQRWRHLFEQESVSAAKTWRFDVTEIVDGKSADGTVLVPVVYYLSRTPRSNSGMWQSYFAGPVHEIPWRKQAPGDSNRIAQLADGEADALDSRFHLKNDVVGKAL